MFHTIAPLGNQLALTVAAKSQLGNSTFRHHPVLAPDFPFAKAMLPEQNPPSLRRRSHTPTGRRSTIRSAEPNSGSYCGMNRLFFHSPFSHLVPTPFHWLLSRLTRRHFKRPFVFHFGQSCVDDFNHADSHHQCSVGQAKLAGKSTMSTTSKAQPLNRPRIFTNPRPSSLLSASLELER